MKKPSTLTSTTGKLSLGDLAFVDVWGRINKKMHLGTFPQQELLLRFLCEFLRQRVHIGVDVMTKHFVRSFLPSCDFKPEP